MTTRLIEIKNWLSSLDPSINLATLHYLQSDASARKYLRCTSGNNSLIVMDTVPGEEMVRFSRIAKILAAHNLNAPKIIAADLERGLILSNDFGAMTYLTKLKSADAATVDKLYLDALISIVKMQRIPSDTPDYKLAVMDDEYIDVRLNVFKTWYLQKHLNLEIDSKIEANLNKMQSLFSGVFKEQPPVFVHVDYHSRNLMVLENGNPGILDFQDAMMGPMTYDLASLFQDAYITYPRSMVESWLTTYKDIAIEAGVIQPQTTSDLLRNFELVGLQRHIKNLGVFARLHHRDNKSNYLNDMPMLLKYITETCSRYPELSWLFDFLKENILELS